MTGEFGCGTSLRVLPFLCIFQFSLPHTQVEILRIDECVGDGTVHGSGCSHHAKVYSLQNFIATISPAVMRTGHLTVLGSSLLLLAACSAKPQQPVLTFVGVASGTIETPTDGLAFTDRVPTDITAIIGVAAFEHAE